MRVLKQKFTVYITLLAVVFGLFNFPLNKPNLEVSADHSASHSSTSVVVTTAADTSSVQASGKADILGCGIPVVTAGSGLDLSLGLNTETGGLLSYPASCFTIAPGQVLTQHSLQMTQLTSLPQIVVQEDTPTAYAVRLNPYSPAAQSVALAAVFALSIATVAVRKRISKRTTSLANTLYIKDTVSLSKLGVMRC